MPVEPPVQEPREFLFTPADFDRVRRLLYQHAGISLSDHKQDMVYSRLSRRLRANGLCCFADYLAIVESGRDGVEWETFVNALTTNLTSFFREPHHFPLLADHARSVRRRPIRLWCSASSTGEEAYTMAMTVVDAFGSFTPPVQIIASDIDTQVLNKAQAGIYPREAVDKLSQDLLKRFFLKGRGARDGYVKVRRELRDLVQFRRLNLLAPNWPLTGTFDAIFCRNVMIYFDKPTQATILRRFAPMLAPDGLLFVGHSESLHHVHDLFRLQGKSVYALTESARHGQIR